MNFFFADDAKQNHPTRQGMGALVAIGGVCVPDSQIRYLESGLNALCMNYGFPPGEWFKWSPNKDQWMRTKLVEDGRQQFFVEAIELANSMGCKALVVIEDSTRSPVKKGLTATDDVTLMFIERVGIRLSYGGTDGIVIADRSFGAPDQEEEFLAGCLETIQQGTKFVTPERIALNVLSTPSRLVRTLQLADVVVSCTLSYIAGEKAYSPPIFDHVKKLLYQDKYRIGGVGLKIQPDFLYANLYHWLLGDEHIMRGNVGYPLPKKEFWYANSPDRS